jgi:hypothetical protein
VGTANIFQILDPSTWINLRWVKFRALNPWVGRSTVTVITIEHIIKKIYT